MVAVERGDLPGRLRAAGPGRAGVARAALLPADPAARRSAPEPPARAGGPGRRAGDRGLGGGPVTQEPHRQRGGDRSRAHPSHPVVRHAARRVHA